MANDLAKLNVKLQLQNQQLLTKLEQSNRRIEGFSRKSARSFNSFKRAAQLAFGVISVAAITRATTSTLSFADGIDKAAKAASVSAEFLQEMRFAGEQLGVEARLVDEGFRRFTRRLGEFANSGAGPAAKAIETLI